MAANLAHAAIQSPILERDASLSPRKSPVRRVLGELTPNTRTVSPKPRDTLSKTPATGSPQKRSRPVTPAEVLNEKHRRESEEGTRPVTGHKRALEDAIDAADFAKRRRDSTWNKPAPPAISSLDTGSTTEEDTPEPEEVACAGGSLHVEEDAAKPKGSFSSLIDYDPTTASDKDHEPSVSPPAEDTENPFEMSIKSRTEMLHLRLRVAMYKVRTGQTNVPMSSIDIPDPKPTPPRASFHEVDVTRSGPPPKKLGLLPAPVLMPTAYSSRLVGAPNAPAARMMSSPPSRHTSPRRWDGSPGALPQPATRTSSPLKNIAHATPAALRVMLESEGDLTSSAVKGRAANGLLELMRGR